eukprot:7077843-Prymnesium_polylepis.1
MGWMVWVDTQRAHVRGRKRPWPERTKRGEVTVITPRTRGEHTRGAHLARSIAVDVLSPCANVGNVLARQFARNSTCPAAWPRGPFPSTLLSSH